MGAIARIIVHKSGKWPQYCQFSLRRYQEINKLWLRKISQLVAAVLTSCWISRTAADEILAVVLTTMKCTKSGGGGDSRLVVVSELWLLVKLYCIARRDIVATAVTDAQQSAYRAAPRRWWPATEVATTVLLYVSVYCSPANKRANTGWRGASMAVHRR